MKKILKYEHKEYLKRWILGGGKVTEYKCPDCKKMIKTIQPTEKLVDSRGFWDSVKICPECKSGAFVKVYPSGKTEVVTELK